MAISVQNATADAIGPFHKTLELAADWQTHYAWTLSQQWIYIAFAVGHHSSSCGPYTNLNCEAQILLENPFELHSASVFDNSDFQLAA